MSDQLDAAGEHFPWHYTEYGAVTPVFDFRPDNALEYVLKRQKANNEADVIYFIGEISKLDHLT